MRHHSAPTRLLDWTKGVLIAAYFATFGEKEESDAIVWGLNAEKLTAAARTAHDSGGHRDLDCECAKFQNINGKPIKRWSVGQAVWLLAKQAIVDHRATEDHECGFDRSCKWPLAIAPPRTFPRMSSQQSWFTIHPNPSHGLTLQVINESLDDSLLQQVRIPRSCFVEYQQDLYKLGINAGTVFPDLDGLASSLIPALKHEYEFKRS